MVALHGQSVNLDHYLEVLQRKPGAFPGSTALAHARATGHFTSAHEAFWAAARKTDGDAGGTRALIDGLMLHRSMAAQAVVAEAKIAAAIRRNLAAAPPLSKEQLTRLRGLLRGGQR